MDNLAYFQSVTVFVHALKYITTNTDDILKFCKEFGSESYSILGRDNNGNLILSDNKSRIAVPVNYYIICKDKKFSVSPSDEFESKFSKALEGEIDLNYGKEEIVDTELENNNDEVKDDNTSNDNVNENNKKSSKNSKKKKRGKKK